MRRIVFSITIFMIVAIFAARAFAGASTTSIVVNGPGISYQGVVITGTWPGWITFINQDKGPAPKPASDLPRYVLTGYTNNYEAVWYTVLYVWDPHASRALVYLPGPSELGYRVNYGGNIEYAKLAGKWYYVLDQGLFQGWANLIRKVLPQSGLSTK